jgi:hypothetical protein
MRGSEYDPGQRRTILFDTVSGIVVDLAGVVRAVHRTS